METPPLPTDSPVTQLHITGMTCANCARHVTEAIQSVSEVRSATVSLENKNASVRWNSGSPQNILAVVQAVKKAGYEAKEIKANDPDMHHHSDWQINLWLGVAVTASLMMGEWIFGLAMTSWFQWLSFALAGIVQIFCGAQFYRGTWNQLKIGSSNMDTLVALGSTTAFGYSTWALLSGAGGHLYFMEAAAIITLISLGHWIEARVSDQASGALKSLLNLAPQTARKILLPRPAKQGAGRVEGTEIEIPVAELKIGDEIILRPGDRVPVDGIVMEGDSAIDESMLTGESIPADKKYGDELFAGYSTFSDVPRLKKLAELGKFLPAPLRRASSPVLRGILGALTTSDAAHKTAAAWTTPGTLPHAYFFARALFAPGSRLESLIAPRFRASTVSADGVTLDPTWLGWLQRAADEAAQLPPIAGISWLEMRTYMASTLLRDTDSVSMARSLEVRVPLLDTPLVEFVSALPDAARRRAGSQKALLVESLRDILPPEILAQRKRTFTLPWEEWLRGPLRPRIEASFASLSPKLAPHLHSEGVRAVWNDFLAKKTSWSRPWTLYVLNEWCRRHLPA